MVNKIINILSETPRLSNESIAKMIGVSEKEVETTISSLEKKGVIQGYKTIINHELLDEPSEVRALVELKVHPRPDTGFDTIANVISQMHEVESVYLMSGGFDLSVMVKGPSMQYIANFVAKRIAAVDGVISTGTHFVMTKYKENNFLFNQNLDERNEYN